MAYRQPQIRPITSGPKYHWFGYYDKLQFDPTNRYVLGMEVDFEHRPPRPDDRIKIGMVDLRDNDRWIELGESRAWCWQQGCMLQWLPGSTSEVIWNDRIDDQFVSHTSWTSTQDGSARFRSRFMRSVPMARGRSRPTFDASTIARRDMAMSASPTPIAINRRHRSCP